MPNSELDVIQTGRSIAYRASWKDVSRKVVRLFIFKNKIHLMRSFRQLRP